MPNNSNQKAGDVSPVKRALYELRTLRSRLEKAEREKSEPIAIVGMGLRFPGASNPESAWKLLQEGTDAITEVPPERWDIDAYYDSDSSRPGKMSTRWGGFIKNIDKFDADFFNISPREAVSMDPQQRLLMTVAWEALEHAGQAPGDLVGSATGVFVGIASFDYAQMQMQYGERDEIDAYFSTGSSHSIASGRLSYFLGLQGPSISLDTACSSSLVSIHIACQSLRQRECNMALAGGVNMIIAPELLINFSKASMMAADGRCKTFDAAADGFVRGEGAGMVVLKRLSDAVTDGDNILAVIRGSAVNQDGRSGGLTAPNGPSQQNVIRNALANAGVRPHEVAYVETHGTGTSLGDPIEVQSLGAVYHTGRQKDMPLFIGSIKTNIGHLETAAGVAGVIKTVLMLQRGEIPRHLHFNNPSPHIPWAKLPVHVAAKHSRWPKGYARRIAAVSSLGFSGTNAHIVLEAGELNTQAATKNPEVDTFGKTRAARKSQSRPSLLNISAKTPEALTDLVNSYHACLKNSPEFALSDVCYTANVGRSHLTHRASFIADNRANMLDKLSRFGQDEALPGILEGVIQPGECPDPVFLFTGQGAQYTGMGSLLYKSQPLFRDVMDQCDRILRNHLEQPLLSVIYPKKAADSPLDDTNYTQPAMFAIQYALAQLWLSWGVQPGLIMGHSVGEIVAATVAGSITLEDGLRLISERGRLTHSLQEQGLMASFLAEFERVEPLVAQDSDKVAIAAINGPDSTVISGERKTVLKIVKKLESEGVKAKVLKVSNAFHSPLVEPALDEFEASAAKLSYKVPDLPLFSSMHLDFVKEDQLLDATYWRYNLRHTVRFHEAMQKVGELGFQVFIEIGPEPMLLGMGQDCLPDMSGVWVPSLRAKRNDWEQILESLATLHIHGVRVDWRKFESPCGRTKVALPTYPFNGTSYWPDWVNDQPGDGAVNASLSWALVKESARRHANLVPADLSLDALAEDWRILNEFGVDSFLGLLASLPAGANGAAKMTAAKWIEKLSVLPQYAGLFQRCLDRAAAQGLLKKEGKQYSLEETALARKADLSGLSAELGPLKAYLETCQHELAALLSGTKMPFDLLCPNGDMNTTRFLFHDWSNARYAHEILRSCLEAILRARERGKSVRILEIGAGTGAVTKALVPVLAHDQVSYCFTDISDSFLITAKETFSDAPYMHFANFDVERNPLEQGLGAGDFDIVIASNMMYATKNIEAALKNIFSLLAPGALLLLNEFTRHHAWFDISLAFLETQTEIKGPGVNEPRFSADKWVEVLKRCRFEEAMAFPERAARTEVLGTHVLLARTPDGAVTGEHVTADILSERGPTAESADGTKNGRGAAVDTITSELKNLPEAQRVERLTEIVQNQVMRTLRRERSQTISVRSKLMDLGIDSLMAVELRDQLRKSLGLSRPLPASLIFDYPTVEAIAAYLEKTFFKNGEPAMEVNKKGQVENELISGADIDELSDEEVEQILLRKLDPM